MFLPKSALLLHVFVLYMYMYIIHFYMGLKLVKVLAFGLTLNFHVGYESSCRASVKNSQKRGRHCEKGFTVSMRRNTCIWVLYLICTVYFHVCFRITQLNNKVKNLEKKLAESEESLKSSLSSHKV